MAEGDITDPEDREVLAGEYALRVLEGEELASAQRLYLSDVRFAEQVEEWRLRLARMAEAAGAIAPSAAVWPAITRRLDYLATSEATPPGSLIRPERKRFSLWNLGAAMGGAAAAAAAVTALVIQPQSVPPVAPTETSAPAAGERLVAQIQSEDGELALAGFVDPQASQIAVSLTGFAPGQGQATELWVVPEGGAPQSLGLVPASGTFERELTTAERASLTEGAALAVTYENAATAPHTAPGSDILVIGSLTSI